MTSECESEIENSEMEVLRKGYVIASEKQKTRETKNCRRPLIRQTGSYVFVASPLLYVKIATNAHRIRKRQTNYSNSIKENVQ